MAALNTKVKAYIVRGLATYMTPSEVVDAVKKEFEGFVITRQQVAKYDPDKASGVNLSDKWRELFEKHRKNFNDEIDSIPIANKAYRLKMLDEMVRDALESKNRPLAAKLLAQAAKEVGGVFANQKVSDHTTGGKEIKSGLGHFYDRAMIAKTKPAVVGLTTPALSPDVVRAISKS